jgi:hypothetical protein
MVEDPGTGTEKRTPIPVSDTLHAPFIFFEGAPAMAFTNGVVSLTLGANRTWIAPDGTVMNDAVVVAHLRGNIQAALSLRRAIDKALLMATPVQEGKAN